MGVSKPWGIPKSPGRTSGHHFSEPGYGYSTTKKQVTHGVSINSPRVSRIIFQRRKEVKGLSDEKLEELQRRIEAFTRGRLTAEPKRDG